MLGSFAVENGERVLHEIRPVPASEYDAVQQAVARLKQFSGHTLIGALVNARNDLIPYLQPTGSLRSQLTSAEFQAKLGAKLGHWLTTFTTFRRQLETLIESNRGVLLTEVHNNFARSHRDHAEFRLTWEMRNFEQHFPPVTRLIRFASEEGRVAAFVDLSRMFAEALAGNARHRSQWLACQALWAGHTDAELAVVVHSAYLVCETINAAAVRDVEPRLMADITTLAKLFGEVADHQGAPCIVRRSPTGVQGRWEWNVLQIDLLVIGEAMVAMNGARKVLGEPEIEVQAGEGIESN